MMQRISLYSILLSIVLLHGLVLGALRDVEGETEGDGYSSCDEDD